MTNENPYASPMHPESTIAVDGISSYTKQGAIIGSLLAGILFAFDVAGRVLDQRGAFVTDINATDALLILPSAVVFVLFPAVGALTGFLVGIIYRSTGS